MKTRANSTRTKIVEATAQMLADVGYEATSMRKLAERTGVKQPVIYYYFESKSELLAEAFTLAQQRIRQALTQAPASGDAHTLLKERIIFTWQHANLVMAMLNYFLGQKTARPDDPMRIPPQAYRHLQEAIDLGVRQGVYISEDSARDAAIMLHALNGFAMEHFPNLAHDQDTALVDDVCSFFERALRRDR